MRKPEGRGALPSDTHQLNRKSNQTRQRILDAAASILATRGFAGTSIKAIADSIDMQDASLYYHFESKDALVLEVLRMGVMLAEEAVTTAVKALGDDPDPVEALRVAIMAHASAVLGMGDYPRANVRNFGQFPPAIASAQMSHHRRYARVWRELVEKAMADGRIRQDLNPSAVRLLILGALNWAPEWYSSEGELSPDAVGEQMAAMIIDGLTGAGTAREAHTP
ncbi:MAG: TetR/AcrR family transcriptional regulator [Pseudomonadales bacterium]